jgi:hypothetical protein
VWNINYKMYYIFATFNAVAFIHMILLAPETKGYTLEEMDEVFNSGLPAWKTLNKASRLEQLEKEIEEGKLKISVPRGGGHGNSEGNAGAVPTEKVGTVHEEKMAETTTA